MLTHLFRILKYWTIYAIATGFFPKDIAKNVLLLYSFVRIPDNIVDEVTPGKSLTQHYKQAKKQLIKLQDERTQSYTNKDKKDLTRGQYITLFQDNQIPFQYSLDFFKAMIDDCTIHRYKTYEQLEWYMYGSASVVWLMMCHLIWFNDENKAKSYAIELWNAMQLTNFLRDIREDYEELNRIYMPSELLQLYGLSHDDIISFSNHHKSKNIIERIKQETRKSYMEMMIQKCREMYAHSLEWLQYLNPQWTKAIKLAAVLYESILDKIALNHYDVFTKSCRTNLRDKLKTLVKFYLKKS